MRTRSLGPLGETSVLALGGAGIAGCWGGTTVDEAIATLSVAVDAGINLIDVAPGYERPDAPREAERLVGETFAGKLPAGTRIVTKVEVLDAPADEIRRNVRTSVEQSLTLMRLERVDLLIHHAFLRPPRIAYLWPTLSMELYRTVLRPEFERLREEGLIGGWGLTAIGHPEAVFDALAEEPRPSVVQSVANVLDSAGAMWEFAHEELPDNAGTQSRARRAGVGVMGVRAVQAGALTAAFDRELPLGDLDRIDYDRAAGFRALAARRGEPVALLAHRYALSLPNIDTVVVGVKNRAELRECIAAAAAEPLTPEELRALEEAVGR